MTELRARNGITLPPSGKAASGRPLCRWCCKEILIGSRGRKWCSRACVDDYLVRKSPADARRLTFARDRGVCALCHIDTERVERIRQFLWERVKGWAADGIRWWDVERTRARWERFVTWVTQNVAASGAQLTAHLWEMDHIIPVSEGGGGCGLTNLRTLCKRCHALQTGQLRRRLNASRSPQPTRTG